MNSLCTLQGVCSRKAATVTTSSTLPVLTNLQLWLDASVTSSLTLSSTSVTTWADQSGYTGRSASLFAGTKPTYSATGFNTTKPGVSFIQSGLMCTIPTGTFLTGMTVFIVMIKTGNANTYEALCARTSGHAGLPLDMYNSFRSLCSGTVQMTSVLDVRNLTSCCVFTLSFNQTSYAEYKNGSSQYTNTFSTSSINDNVTSAFYIGTRDDKATLFTGTMAEIVVYNAALTSTQRKSVEAYLGAKWGITVTA
jgi:hypothetical protein